MKRLTPRERLFVENRAKGLNGVQAIQAAGFKGTRPSIAAAKVSTRPHVQAALEALLSKIAAKAGVTQEQWFEEVWAVARTKVRGIKPADKNKALEMAGRALGAFKDTAGEREVIGPGLTIIVQQGLQVGHDTVVKSIGVDVKLPGPAR